MTRRDDDHLLERLGAALAPPAAEPSAAEVSALHRMVAGHDDAVATVTSTRPDRAWGWRLGLVAAAALVLMVVLVARPDPSGDSAELARARTSLQQLRQVIDRGDRVAIAGALAVSERRVAALDPAERAEVQPEAARLQEQARSLLAAPTTTSPPPTTTTSTTTVPPPPVQTATTVDDKGGLRDRSGSNSGPG